MIYIQVHFQNLWDYFVENIVPYKFQDDGEDETMLWLDRWINWIVGTPLLDGTDQEYLYDYSNVATAWLDGFDIEYCIIDEEGNEVEAR